MAHGETYEQFVEKFKPKLTTDECYTPPEVYSVVERYVQRILDAQGVKDYCFLRPFYPGGNYEAYEYGANAVVVDNPPFSIIRKIVDFYSARRIQFFLFAPGLTAQMLTSDKPGMPGVTLIYGGGVVYHNGARVNTCFVTNLLPEFRVIIDPTLRDELRAAQGEGKKCSRRKYVYPPGVYSSGKLLTFAERAAHGLAIRRCDTAVSGSIVGTKVFGGALLCTDRIAQKLSEIIPRKDIFELSLTEKEQAVIDALNGKAGAE